MPELAVFVDLEERMDALLAREMRLAVQDQRRELVDAARAGNLARAHRAADGLNFGRAVGPRLRQRLELVGLNAVLLGASQWVDGQEAKNTRFVRDREVPPEVERAVDQLVMFVDGGATESVRAEVSAVIQAAEAEDMEEILPTIKSEDAVYLLKQFGRGQLAAALNAAVDSGTKIQSSIGANLTTSRLVNFGALAQAQALGSTTYQWNSTLDSVTCPFCRGMHGKTFTVRPSRERLQQILTAQDPDVARALSPWPQQNIQSINRLAGFDRAKLEAEGFNLPPAHPRCRCVVSPTGTVPKNQIIGFEGALRLNFTDRGIARALGTSPAQEAAPAAVLDSAPLVPRRSAGSTAEMFQRPDGTWLESRVGTVHKEALEDLFQGSRAVPAGEQPVYEFLGGGSGAGKGTIQEAGLVRTPRGSVVVDADELKKALPEYREMVAAKDSSAAAFAHLESSHLSNQALARGFATRRHMVLDGTGDGGIDKIRRRILPAREAGYRIKADYVTIPTDEAVLRAAERASATGRMVPESAIRKIHRDVSDVMPRAMNEGLFDEVRLWDNSGSNPVLVMEQIDGRQRILRQDLWDDFLAKSDEDIAKEMLTKADFNAIKAGNFDRNAR